MVNINRFASLAGALLLAAFSVACQKSESSPGAATSTSSFASAKPPAKPDGRPIIVAFGDSLTAGFGLHEDQGFVTLLQRKLDEKGYRYRVAQAGMSGDTSAGGGGRNDWAAAERPLELLLLSVCGKDGVARRPVRTI